MQRSDAPFEPGPLLDAFRQRCRHSREYQGHGWGAAWRSEGQWTRHRSLTPIWDDPLQISEPVDFLIVHARSAFRDTGIEVENNMPFYEGDQTFVFNGELHGVRLRLPGRIGAERVFHLVQRVQNEDDSDLAHAVAKADALINAKSRYVRALNMAVTDGNQIVASCRFNESPDYFTMHTLSGEGVRAVGSEPMDARWAPMQNGQQVTL